MMKSRLTWMVAVSCLLIAGLGCGPEGEGGDRAGQLSEHDSMESFDSDEEYLDYMEQLDESSDSGSTGPGMEEEAQDDADTGAPSGDPDQDNEDITNTQEDDVDEGGIVKNVGDYLVVLRRGALYAVDVAESGDAEQVDSIRVAPDEDLNSGVWYDEMLVRGNQIYIVGYRYHANVQNDDDDDWFSWLFGATEVSSFVLDDGQLHRGETTFFESNDYYSGTNYASRLVDGELIFYMPYFVAFKDGDNPVPHIPQFLKHQDGADFLPDGPLFNPTDVIAPPELPEQPMFHTVIQCELPDDLSIDCSARSLLADPAREFYVSSEHIHLFSSGHVFALEQTGDASAAHAVDGRPADQFSFSEVDGKLHVSVLDQLDADEAGVDEETPSWELPYEFRMLTLPLEDFDAEGEQSLEGKSELISEELDSTWGISHRHVDGWYIAGYGEDVYAHDIDDGTTYQFQVDGSVTRIEAAPGIGALVMHHDSTEDGSELLVDSILLDGATPEHQTGADLEGMREGEHRSHGFFFNPGADGGQFGLAVLDDGSSGSWWGGGAANVGFFDASSDGSIDFAGAVSSTEEAGGDCETSCVDWYGNTRPIFLSDRIYALMGSELAEVDVGDDVQELDRVVLSLD